MGRAICYGLVTASALVLGACGKPSPSSAAPTMLGAPHEAGATTSLAFSAIDSWSERNMCGAPDEHEIRVKLPSLPACLDATLTALEFRISGHDVLVVHVRRDASVTWHGRSTAIDGKEIVELPPSGPFYAQLGKLEPATDADAVALLEVIAFSGGAPASGGGSGSVMGDLVLTPAETRTMLERFPAASAAVTANPPGVARESGSWHLRVWQIVPSSSADGGAAQRCPTLVRNEVSIVHGSLVVHSGSALELTSCPPPPVADAGASGRTNAEWKAWWDAREHMTPAQKIAADDEVIVGKVSSLGKEPGFWSGFATAWQDVDFEVVSTWKGSTPAPHVTVGLEVVASDFFARKDRPGLSPAVLAKGSKWIIGIVKNDSGARLAYDILRDTPAEETRVKTALGAAKNP